MKLDRELAKCEDFDVVDNDRGGLMLAGSFKYEDGGSQGLGYMIDADFIQRFMQVFDVQALQSVNGRSCWVTHGFDRITKIEPLHKKDGAPFDILEWVDQKKIEREIQS